jgi:hypothetical protein
MIGDGPFNVVLPLQDLNAHVTYQDEVTLRPNGIQVGAFKISIDQSPVWDPVFTWECFHTRGLNQEAIQVFHGKIKTVKGNLTHDMSSTDTVSNSTGATTMHHAQLVRNGRNFCQSILRDARDQTRFWFDQLCGLGIGLTPQGDDLLIGCLYACYASEHLIGDTEWIADLVRSGLPQTTTLSAAWLKAASAGESSAIWHRLLNAMDQANSQQIRVAVDSILAQGYSSGFFSLLGFETGLKVFSPRIDTVDRVWPTINSLNS